MKFYMLYHRAANTLCTKSGTGTEFVFDTLEAAEKEQIDTGWEKQTDIVHILYGTVACVISIRNDAGERTFRHVEKWV